MKLPRGTRPRLGTRSTITVDVTDDDSVVVEVVEPDAAVAVTVDTPPLLVVGTATVGPSGPPGPTAISADAYNYARLGSDSLLFVPIAVQSSAPAAPPIGMVWIDTS